MSKGNTFENEFLLHIFNNAAIALIGDASGLQPSATAGSLYVSLHTADPGEAGDQSTNEVSYGSYARVAVARSSAGWTVTGNGVENTSTILFPTGTSGSVTQNGVAWAVGTASSGAGKILYKGTFTTAIYTGLTIQPVILAGDLDITED